MAVSKKEVLDAMMDLAATDWNFRQRLIAEPRAALKETLGLVLSPAFKIRFIERGDDLDALVVLPRFRGDSGEDDDQQDDDVASVSGGRPDGEWLERCLDDWAARQL
jgi:hypothetical protein